MDKNHHKLRRGFGSIAIISVLAVLIVGVGAYFLTIGSQQSKNMANNAVSQETPTVATDNVVENVSYETGTMMKDDPRLAEMSDEELAADGSAMLLEEVVSHETVSSGQPGQYIELTSLAEAEEMAANKDVLLFFHAVWCPSCRGLEIDIEKNLANIPENLIIYKVNFDTDLELRKKYGVARQHTLVQIDSSGNEIQTLTGLTNTLKQVVSQL